MSETRTASQQALALPLQGALSVGMGGFLMLMGSLSFPLPWTPVPFSMLPFALLVAGAVQKPQWSLLSVILYLVAGGLGAHVFAGGASGWHHFGEHTAGYLFGFLLVSPIVSAYVARPRRVLGGPWRYAAVGASAAAAVIGLAAIGWLISRGVGIQTLDADAVGFGTVRSVLWIGLFILTTALLAYLLLRRRSGQWEASLQLFFVMMMATLVLHALGVLVLWQMTSLGLMSSIIVGSIVFLPFDILKAGLAVAVTQPWLPPESEHA